MLSDEQKREFVRDGYLVIEDGIDEPLVDEGSAQIWEAVPEEPDDPESLLGVGSRTPDVPSDEPFMTVKRRLYEYCAEMVGEALVAPTEPGMQLALRYPQERRLDTYHDRRPLTGHLDGYGPGYKESGEYSTWEVAAVVYFDDVVDRGGGFTVWPGSHWVAAEYFEEHALNTLGYAVTLPAIDDEGGWDRNHLLCNQIRSRELNYDAGTVILWHNKIMHTSGVNQSPNVRMAGICRFSREDQRDIFEDAADKPFKYWDGVADVDLED